MQEVLAGNNAAQEATPATQATAAPAGMSLDAAKPYIDSFGDRGAKWYLEGRSMADCFADVSKELQAANTELSAKITELEGRLDAALKAASGEPEALSTNERIELSESKKLALQKTEDLKAQGASEKTAKWAAAFSN